MLFVWDSSFHCVPFRMTFDCHSERGYQPMRNPSLRSWVEILPPCGRQNDSFRGRLPYVIPSEAGSHLSFRTETYGRV